MTDRAKELPKGDEHLFAKLARGETAWEPSNILDFSKVKRADGVTRYRLYRQDGSMQDMTCADTLDNRVIVSWIQIHDRY